MGTLTNYIKESKLGKILSEAGGAFWLILNSEVDDDGDIGAVVNAAIKENPEQSGELKKFEEIARLTDTDLAQQAERFEKVEDSKYNDLENKLEDIEATVNEVAAKSVEKNDREKGGRQRTRVDED